MPHPAARLARSPSRPDARPDTRPVPHPVVYVVRGRPGPADRAPLPPGSPESWGAITANTVLDHAPYPFPLFSWGR